jgi:hypothetical protein
MQGSRNVVTTGCPSLDGLVGGLRGGQFYLFCGATPFLDELTHRLVVRGATEGKVAYMNNTDYYHEKTLLRTDLLAFHAKREGVDPSRVLDNVYFVAAYSEFRQPKATNALSAMLESEPSTRMILVHNVSTFLMASERKGKAMKRDLIMVVTATAEAPGSSLLADLANVIVFFRGKGSVVRALLLKHPDRTTPADTAIYASAGVRAGGEPLMGRITPPFRQLYQETLERLRSNYVALLRDPENKNGFDLLLKEAWDREHAAMGNSELPLVLDALNLTANVHNSGAIAELRNALEERDGRIGALEERVRRIEALLPSSAEGDGAKEKAKRGPLAG